MSKLCNAPLRKSSFLTWRCTCFCFCCYFPLVSGALQSILGSSRERVSGFVRGMIWISLCFFRRGYANGFMLMRYAKASCPKLFLSARIHVSPTFSFPDGLPKQTVRVRGELRVFPLGGNREAGGVSRSGPSQRICCRVRGELRERCPLLLPQEVLLEWLRTNLPNAQECL